MTDDIFDDMARDLAKTGGPAFPMVGESYSQFGMTLRDYFAGQALPSVFSVGSAKWDSKTIAVAAYKLADAMLAEKGKS